MVGSGSLENKFVLSEVVAKTGKRAELIPKKNCVLLKLSQQSPGPSAMIFPSGKVFSVTSFFIFLVCVVSLYRCEYGGRFESSGTKVHTNLEKFEISCRFDAFSTGKCNWTGKCWFSH
jgi:hypothetical protein